MERPQITLSEYRTYVAKIYERITKGKALPHEGFGIVESCYEGGMIENSASYLIWYSEVVGLTEKALWYATELRNSNEDFLSRLAFHRLMKREINRTRKKDDSGWLFEFTIYDFKKTAICKKCGSFQNKDNACPSCGSKSRR